MELARSVVFCTPGLRDRGGAARRSELLTGELALRGWRVLVIARSAGGVGLRRDIGGRRTVLEVPAFGLGRVTAPLYILLGIVAGLVVHRRPGAVVGIQLNSPAMLAALLSKIWRVPLVLLSTSDGMVEVDAMTFGSPTIRNLLFGKRANLIVQTESAASSAATWTTLASIAVLPNPVELPDLSGVSRRGRPRGEVLYVYSGRFIPEKNIDTLLDAWASVVQADNSLRLRLIGGGNDSYGRRLRERVAADRLLSSTVQLVDWVDEVSPELEAADVFVLPSKREGISNSLLEACAHGLTVIASDIPGNRHVLGDDYPLVFDPSDTAGLVRCLLMARDDGLRDELQCRTRQRAELFSVSSVVTRFEELLVGLNDQAQ